MSISVRNIKGIIGVINTPFTSENKIDTDSLEKYVEHSLKCKVAGFLVLGLAAEVHKLAHDEKLLIAETVVKKTDGKVPVIGGTAATCQNERINLAKEFSESGCDGILVNIPFENEHSFISDVKAISNNISGFMMLQDWDFHGHGIPINIISKLFSELDNFKCLKIEVVPAGIKYSQVGDATNGKLHLSGGWAGTQMIEALDRGVDAFMPTILHDVYGMIYHLHSNGKREEAKMIFNKLLPIISFSHQHLDISIHFNKRLVHRQGMFATPNVREPILKFDEYHENIADELIDYAIQLGENVEKE
ncbi:dihydrodipicolinate synthase family protein [candidate division KSB1 bacterium]|nr:dihydrodipicolinate synthase family protein [candidate division KSB1 bacterium]